MKAGSRHFCLFWVAYSNLHVVTESPLKAASGRFFPPLSRTSQLFPVGALITQRVLFPAPSSTTTIGNDIPHLRTVVPYIQSSVRKLQKSISIWDPQHSNTPTRDPPLTGFWEQDLAGKALRLEKPRLNPTNPQEPGKKKNLPGPQEYGEQ